MTCTASLSDCINSVCIRSGEVNDRLDEVVDAAGEMIVDLATNGEAVKCVVNGSAGQNCTMPEGAVLSTLAEALARLNACQIAAIDGEQFTATQGQTQITISAAPANAWSLELALNGAICRDPADYILSGSVITFTHPLVDGDTIYTRSFSV